MLISHPTQFLAAVISVALAVSFVHILLNKWKVWEYLQVHADGWLEKLIHKHTEILNEAFSCIFCLSWWISVIFCLFLLLVTGDFSFLLVPFCSTPLARRIA